MCRRHPHPRAPATPSTGGGTHDTHDEPGPDRAGARREDLLTFRMGYGMVFEPAFEPPYPVITAAAELDLVMGPPDIAMTQTSDFMFNGGMAEFWRLAARPGD